MDWITWVPTVVLALGLFIGKNWIKAGIEKSVQHNFNTKLETVRAELRMKEAQISALREGVLSGRANRSALLDKRRIEAVENVWAAFMKLGPYKFISAAMANIKFDVVADKALTDPKVRKFFEIFGSFIPDEPIPKDLAQNEQPFVSPIAWAYFSAYQATVFQAFLRLKMLEIGLEKPGEFVDEESAKKLLKAALPHQSDFIDKHDSGAYHYLLEELEGKLLAELRGMLEGKDIDEASVAQSVEIMKQVGKVSMNNAELAKVEGAT